MKRHLLYCLFAALFIVAASSCQKYVDQPAPSPLAGHWYLQNAARYDSYKWQTVETGYENGIFTFRSNGDLLYNDALGELRGTWSMHPANGGYYDENGRYAEGYHVLFSMRLYEAGNTNAAADWMFDDNNYNGGNTFKAIYNAGNTTYEYQFAKE